MMNADPDVLSMASTVLADRSDSSTVRAAEGGELPPALVAAVVEAGLPWIGVPESAGGLGGTSDDAVGVLELAGYAACPFPFAESALTAGRVAADAGLAVPDQRPYVVAVAPQARLENGTLVGALDRVPWLRQIRDVVVVTGDDHVVVVEVGDGEVVAGSSLCGEPRDSSLLDLPVTSVGTLPDAVARTQARLAASRVVLMAGATRRVVELAVRYAGEREQFGRPINAFQAVAHHLAVMAEEATLVNAAAQAAAAALTLDDPSAEVAAAKVVAGESASVVAQRAHQVFGAMGVTEECDLQLFTRRLWTWRDEAGAESHWAGRFGDEIIAAGPAGLWDLVVAPVGRSDVN